jgi:hypothetical protein
MGLVFLLCDNLSARYYFFGIRTTERTLARLDDVSFMRPSSAPFILPVIGGTLEEVRFWVLARSIDVIVVVICPTWGSVADSPLTPQLPLVLRGYHYALNH